MELIDRKDIIRLGLSLNTLNELNVKNMITYEILLKTFSNRNNEFWLIKNCRVCSIFRNTGLSAVEPIGYAKEIQSIFGKNNVSIYGFFEWNNNETLICKELNVDGLDFALLYNRYLIDPWMTDVCSLPVAFKHYVHTVYDLDDHVLGAHAQYVYGSRDKWELNQQ